MTLIDLRTPGRTEATDAGRLRLIDATLRCVARWGIAKTTLDDVAREAGCSRATVYRLFPGGKESLLDAVITTEAMRFFTGLAERLAATDTLEDLLVAAMTYAGRSISDHEALQFLLAHEPEVVLPRVAFRHMDEVLRDVSEFGAPFLAPYVGAAEAPRAVEWVTRLVLSYTLSPAESVDFADDESVRHLVRTFVLPGLVQHGPIDKQSSSHSQ